MDGGVSRIGVLDGPASAFSYISKIPLGLKLDGRETRDMREGEASESWEGDSEQLGRA